MSSECPGRSKLTQPMSHHVLGYEDGDVPASVVDRNSESNHIGHDHRSSRPCPDHSSSSTALDRLHFLGELSVHIRAFFY